MFSKRSKSIDTSGIRRMFELGASLKDPINLSIGQPAFDALPEMREAAVAAINDRKSGYTVTEGIAPLRTEILKHHEARDQISLKDYDVLVTAGVSGAFLLSYFALLDPSQEILIPDPFFGMYRDLARLVSATPVSYDTYPTFRISVERLESLVTPQTKAIVVNTPANPTGVALTQDEVDEIIDFAKRHDLWVLFDEIYSLFTYDFKPPVCFNGYEKVILLNGFSKSHGVPGWRLGYVIASKDVIAELKKVQQYTIVCAPSVLQWSAVKGISLGLDPIVKDYQKKRDIIYDALKDSFEVVRPEGAFYIFPKAPAQNAQEFAMKCLKHNLLVVPGNVFSARDTHFRISFSVPDEVLYRGIEVLGDILKN
jgi:aspartate/methionine/tyrosine aminotransferase